MDFKTSSTVPDGKKRSTSAEDSSKLDPLQQRLHRKRFSPEEKCYLAHHVNQCHDHQDLRQMFNQHFGTDRTLESIELFIFKCDDRQFFDLTEQAQDYKRWCTPHPMSPIVPPSMVLGTAEWRTELRAFLVFQASNNVTLTDLKESFSATFPEESRTSGQISIQLAHINQQQSLVRQLEWFAATYRWHPSYVAPASATAAFEADAKAAARARLGQDKQQAKDYVDNEAALTAQLESLNQHSHSLAMSNTGNASASEELAIADQSTNQFGESVSGFDSPSATIIADFVEPFAANFSGSAISKILRQAFTEPAPGLTYDEALAIQTGLFAESARATFTAAPGSGAPYPTTIKELTCPRNRPGHAAGRARSSSAGRYDTRVEGGVKRERGRSL